MLALRMQKSDSTLGEVELLNRYFTASLLILFVFPCICAATEFDRPWQDTTLAIILDPYHANRLNFERVQTDFEGCGYHT